MLANLILDGLARLFTGARGTTNSPVPLWVAKLLHGGTIGMVACRGISPRNILPA